MISELLCIGNYACVIGGYVIRNKDLIITSYNIIDAAKFSFYAIDRIGLIDSIRNKLAKKYNNIIFMDFKTEETDVGEFELMTVTIE